jgi:hypothetical protein
MQAERDELRKHIFPQLRKLCESRGVTWGELDLRWGIDTSDETAAEEKVLRTCLDEVERCRPFFIGMLGERYGWLWFDTRIAGSVAALGSIVLILSIAFGVWLCLEMAAKRPSGQE